MNWLIPWNEIQVSVTRASGAGGQHVNRTNSAVQLRFSVKDSLVLSDEQKSRILHKLAHRIVGEGELLVRMESERDQKMNKESAYKLLNKMISQALVVPKKRIATAPSRSSVRKRLGAKKHRSDLKKNRSQSFEED